MGSVCRTTGWGGCTEQGGLIVRRSVGTRLFLFGLKYKMFKTLFGVILLLSLVCWCRAYETVNSTQIRIENNSAQRDYQEQEDGKVLPFRTFLTTVEIIIICVSTVILFILLVLFTIYLCVYGCVLPKCCRRQSKEYTQVQLNRERKISGIWKTNQNTV